jgi:hypothetical protein
MKDLGLNEHGRWIYDLWYQYVQKWQIAGKNFERIHLPTLALDVAASRQTVLSTAYLFKLFKHIPGILPFGFITTFFQFDKKTIEHRISEDLEHRSDYDKCTSSLYVPFTSDIRALTAYYVVKTNERVTVSPMTILEAVHAYFDHSEHKSANGSEIGEMKMRKVTVQGWIPQGKESSYEVLAMEDTGLPDSLARESIDMEYLTQEEWQALVERIRGYGVINLAKELGISRSTFSRLLQSRLAPHREIIRSIKSRLNP